MKSLILQPEIPLEEVEAMWLFNKILQHEMLMPELRWLFHVPNGGWRNVTVGAKLKREGVRRGVPDYIWPLCRDGYPGFYLELKRVKGGGLEPEQKEYRDWLVSQGYRWVMCRGAAEAWEAIMAYHALQEHQPVGTA